MFAVRIAALAVIAFAQGTQAQTDPSNIPQPPTDALVRFQPFLGTYTVTGNFAGQEWAGTLDVRPAVKGWYVEWEFNVHSGPIDRQLRLLMTWDAGAEQYRIWRFETLPPLPSGTAEGTGWFKGDEFVMEWAMPAPDGEAGTIRNRVQMEAADTLVIVTEGERASGDIQRIGVTTARRRL